LHYPTAYYNKKEILQLLIDSNVAIDKPIEAEDEDSFNQQTALHLAAQRGKLQKLCVRFRFQGPDAQKCFRRS